MSAISMGKRGPDPDAFVQAIPTLQTEQAAAMAEHARAGTTIESRFHGSSHLNGVAADRRTTYPTDPGRYSTSIPLPSATRYSPGFEPQSTRPINTVTSAQSTTTYVPLQEVKPVPTSAPVALSTVPAREVNLKQSSTSLRTALTGPSALALQLSSNASLLSSPASRGSSSPARLGVLGGYLQIPSNSKSTIV
jgi:hypothetical protein